MVTLKPHASTINCLERKELLLLHYCYGTTISAGPLYVSPVYVQTDVYRGGGGGGGSDRKTNRKGRDRGVMEPNKERGGLTKTTSS